MCVLEYLSRALEFLCLGKRSFNFPIKSLGCQSKLGLKSKQEKSLGTIPLEQDGPAALSAPWLL